MSSQGSSPVEYSYSHCILNPASLVPQLVKNVPAMRETWIHSLGWEDPLEEGTATHSSILAWRIPWPVQSQIRMSDFHQILHNASIKRMKN